MLFLLTAVTRYLGYINIKHGNLFSKFIIILIPPLNESGYSSTLTENGFNRGTWLLSHPLNTMYSKRSTNKCFLVVLLFLCIFKWFKESYMNCHFKNMFYHTIWYVIVTSLKETEITFYGLFFFNFRSQRLQFDVSSPNGILLFREVSKIIVSYGEY